MVGRYGWLKVVRRTGWMGDSEGVGLFGVFFSFRWDIVMEMNLFFFFLANFC